MSEFSPQAATVSSLFDEADVAELHAPQTAGRQSTYQRLANRLRQAIVDGQLAAGECFPPEREMAQQFKVSRDTVRRALELLTQQGLIESRQGAGTFVASRVEQPLAIISSFSDDMRQRGHTPGSFWIRRELGWPTPEESLALNLLPDQPVMRLDRVRTADGTPMAVERAVISAALLGNNLDFGESLYDALRAVDVRPARAMQRLRAQLASVADAGLLAINPLDAVLSIERRSFSNEGRPIELTRSVYRGDRYDYLSVTAAEHINMSY
ncbi:transcriptional regulator, GntR family [Andreprevotia lacus DSM 23236]|jgi:GntR family transcriptional regulator|uniref:Transcriptional regulator, GntR family n=1 Tax=Andreprevotia lacus DSM 23236 TaxID=1121001 RepID=A0A1W1XW53_9NEIS|nr:GntR family transcriptional regulator [Andreprevotia lacus]SMC27748.1 transcriptional regulator, GntR family [Andreprevotia lacus DSM 23236]